MKQRYQIKKLLTSLFIGILLLLISAPSSVHAQSLDMNHADSIGMTEICDNSCPAQTSTQCLCGNATTIVPNDNKTLYEFKQEDEPIPPNAIPYYVQWQTLFIPQKLHNIYTKSASQLQPPDLILLYSKLRI